MHVNFTVARLSRRNRINYFRPFTATSNICAQICLLTRYVNRSIFSLIAESPNIKFEARVLRNLLFATTRRTATKGGALTRRRSSINHIQRCSSRCAVNCNHNYSTTPPLIQRPSLMLSSPPPRPHPHPPCHPHSTDPYPHPIPSPDRSLLTTLTFPHPTTVELNEQIVLD